MFWPRSDDNGGLGGPGTRQAMTQKPRNRSASHKPGARSERRPCACTTCLQISEACIGFRSNPASVRRSRFSKATRQLSFARSPNMVEKVYVTYNQVKALSSFHAHGFVYSIPAGHTPSHIRMYPDRFLATRSTSSAKRRHLRSSRPFNRT